MSTLSVAGLIGLWTTLVQAGFMFGIADGALSAKAVFAVAIIAAIFSQRPNSTKSWLGGLNR